MCSVLQVSYLLLLSDAWISSKDFRKVFKIKFREKPFSGGRVVQCGQTDRQTYVTKLMVAFSNSAKAPTTINLYRPRHNLNLFTPDDPYKGRTATLTSKRFILYIYSINIDIEYFKHGINSPFFPLQNAVCFIILTYLAPVLFTFYIQDVPKLKKIPAPKC